jgi:heme ABC exporter ATP-binding subunit CcmA
MADAIRFRSVVALLGGFPVLAGVDLDVARGEVVLLEGANGAGKSSLLRACAGLLAVTSGDAEVLGHDLLRDRRSLRRQIGLLGHATSLYDDLTVEDNVRFATRAGGGRSDSVGAALGRLGLTGRLTATPVGRLSAGQRRRTALAVLVARDPELWLLDEPHAGLDAEHRDLLDGIVRDAVERGATVVLASHEHERASALAGRVVTVAGGQVVATVGRGPGPSDAGSVPDAVVAPGLSGAEVVPATDRLDAVAAPGMSGAEVVPATGTPDAVVAPGLSSAEVSPFAAGPDPEAPSLSPVPAVSGTAPGPLSPVALFPSEPLHVA